MAMRLSMATLAAGALLISAPAAPATGAERATAGGVGAGAGGEVPRALASNGAIVAMPELAGLGCREMAEVLRRIDEAGYRGPVPVPADHADRPIFEYEHRLAAAYYRGCILAGHRLDDPGPAFARGFETP